MRAALSRGQGIGEKMMNAQTVEIRSLIDERKMSSRQWTLWAMSVPTTPVALRNETDIQVEGLLMRQSKPLSLRVH